MRKITQQLLLIFYAKEEKIYPAYVSKHNSTREKQAILLMISNEDRSGALSCSQKTTSIIKRNNFWTSLWFLLSEFLVFFRNKKKIESHKRVFKNKGFCNVVMPSEDTKIYNLVKIKNLVKHQLLFMLILSV